MISAPESYGLDAAATLAHVVTTRRPEGFDAFWRDLREAVRSEPVRAIGSADDEVGEIVLASHRGVRVAGRLTRPPGDVRGIVLTTHGSGAPDRFEDAPEPWSDAGLATFRLRVRGYPPSTIDLPDLRATWILHRIEVPDAWILRGAVADVLHAHRWLRRAFGSDVPIMLHGESLGGGLAVIAAAQLEALGDPPARLAVGLPSFGDWDWRAGRFCAGTGGQVNMALDGLREERHRVEASLRLHDAALHASDVRCPVLAKVAERDDVVPAPSAAAVVNALAGRPRYRFVVPYGHFDGGLANARRHALFERLHVDFLDPARSMARFLARHQEHVIS